MIYEPSEINARIMTLQEYIERILAVLRPLELPPESALTFEALPSSVLIHASWRPG